MQPLNGKYNAHFIILTSESDFLTPKTYILIYHKFLSHEIAKKSHATSQVVHNNKINLRFSFPDPKNLYFDMSHVYISRNFKSDEKFNHATS